MVENSQNAKIEAQERIKGKIRFFVVLSVLVMPIIIYFLVHVFGTLHCKPLMILKKEETASNGDSIAHVLPKFSLINQYGQVFTDDSLRNYYHVANFVFTTCPGICKPLSRKFLELQNKLKKFPKVRLISYSVDPQTDSVPILAQYANQYKAQKGRWYFLTGKESEVINVIKTGYFQPVLIEPSGKEKVTHSDRVVLIDKDLRIRGFYQIIDSEFGEKEEQRLLDEINVLDCEYRESKKNK